VPSILLGGSEDWPAGLDPVSENRWVHIIREHGPEAASGKTRFDIGTDVGDAVFDTITRGDLIYDGPDGKTWRSVVNGQEIEVVARSQSQMSGGYFVVSAYPVE
jgi:hypothetical protein